MSVTLVFYPGIVHSTVAPIADGSNPVSTVTEINWNVVARISASRKIQWKIIAQGISVFMGPGNILYQDRYTDDYDSGPGFFNVRTRIHATGRFVDAGLARPIVWPIDVRRFVPAIAYNVEVRKSAQKKSTFNVHTRISAKHTTWFNALITLYAHKATSFNALARVHKPGVSLELWKNQLVATVVHPISYANYDNPTLAEWNVIYRQQTQKIIRFNDHGRLSTKKSIAFNDFALEVICQKAVSWETLMRL